MQFPFALLAPLAQKKIRAFFDVIIFKYKHAIAILNSVLYCVVYFFSSFHSKLFLNISTVILLYYLQLLALLLTNFIQFVTILVRRGGIHLQHF